MLLAKTKIKFIPGFTKQKKETTKKLQLNHWHESVLSATVNHATIVLSVNILQKNMHFYNTFQPLTFIWTWPINRMSSTWEIHWRLTNLTSTLRAPRGVTRVAGAKAYAAKLAASPAPTVKTDRNKIVTFK